MSRGSFRIGAAALASALVGVAVGGCDRGLSRGPSGSAGTAASPSSAPLASTAPVPTSPPQSAPAPASSAPSYVTAAPVSGKSIGHTSVVFKLKLEGGLEAAFKPRSRRGRDRYRGEIAAYRVGISLGLSNVPTALPRAFPLASLQAAMGPASPARTLLDQEAVSDPDGELPGALLPWIAKLEFLPLETNAWRSRYADWLSGNAPPPPDGQTPMPPDAGVPTVDARAMAAQISTLIVFDALTGNWDRWSGGQVGFARATQTLLFMDNDGAFYEQPPPGPSAAQFARLAKVDRFSRGFVGSLRAFDPKAARLAIGDDGRGTPILSDKALAGLEERRKRILGIVDAKIASKGDSAVLFFP